MRTPSTSSTIERDRGGEALRENEKALVDVRAGKGLGNRKAVWCSGRVTGAAARRSVLGGTGGNPRMARLARPPEAFAAQGVARRQRKGLAVNKRDSRANRGALE